MQSNAIEAVGLRKTYPPDVRALDGLSLTVPGGIFGLLGPNGAGKSTAVRVLSTMSTPDAGSARVAGIEVLAQPAKVRGAIGVVGQRYGSDTAATARENLALQGEFQGLTGQKLRLRIDGVLERVGLRDIADRRVSTFSGGMRRRLDIALGLLHEPAVLFLDEPTTGLDPEARADLWAEIRRLADEGTTVLLTTHYLEEADRLAARLAIIDRGRVVVEGTPDELKRGLHGDAINVEVAPEDDGAARAALERIDGLADVVADAGVLHARADEGGAAVPAVLKALDAHGIKARSVTVARPSLDDVYLRHAGRAYAA